MWHFVTFTDSCFVNQNIINLIKNWCKISNISIKSKMNCVLSNYNHSRSMCNFLFKQWASHSSSARNEGMSEVGRLLAKGWFGLCVGSVGGEQGTELSPPSSSQRMWEALGLHERLWEKLDTAHYGDPHSLLTKRVALDALLTGCACLGTASAWHMVQTGALSRASHRLAPRPVCAQQLSAMQVNSYPPKQPCRPPVSNGPRLTSKLRLEIFCKCSPWCNSKPHQKWMMHLAKL